MAGADPEVGCRDHHRHGGQTDVVLVGHLPALTRRYRQDESDRSRGVRDVARALPHLRKFLQLSMIGNGRRPRGSRLAVASNIAPRPQPMSTFVA
jgi:hypothetical protein